jgi:hypothetical protein
MFLYKIIGVVVSSIGVYRRSHYAVLKKEKDEKACEERVTAALAERQAASLMRQGTLQDEQGSGISETENEEEVGRPRRATVTTMDQDQLVDIIRREMSKPEAEKSDARDHTGPSFALPYKD